MSERQPGTWLYPLVSWLASALLFAAAAVARSHLPGGPGAEVRYYAVLASVGANLVISARVLSTWGGAFSVIIAGIPLLAAGSLFTAPGTGPSRLVIELVVKATMISIAGCLAVAALAQLRARDVTVKVLRLPGKAGFPLMEGERAFLTDGKEFLHEADLESGRSVWRVKLTLPDPTPQPGEDMDLTWTSPAPALIRVSG